MHHAGFTQEEFIGLTLEDILEPKSLKKAMTNLTDVVALSEMEDSKPSDLNRTMELEQYSKTGELIPIEVSAKVHFDSTKAPKKVIGITRDISDRKKTEKERARLEERLLQSMKMESLGVMAGSIAHNFNNLLMVVMGNLELAKMSVSDNSGVRENLYAALKAAARAADLSTMMLTYVGQLKKDAQVIDLADVVKWTVSDLKDSLGGSIVTALNLSQEKIPIYADREQVRQVVVGIITNSVESFDNNSGQIDINAGVMNCDAAYFHNTYLKETLPEGRYAFIEISDNGCGMNNKTLQKIFDPYFSTKFTGRGLGLAAVLGIIRSHGGAISVHSTPRAGSTFRIVFPYHEPIIETRPQDKPLPEHTIKKLAILLVDDEAPVLDIGKKLIEKAGFSVITAIDGKSALNLYRDNNDIISCVLLDFSMPGMGGIETMAELRKIDPDIKVIMTSGYTRKQIEGNLKNVDPPLDVIHKPFTLDTLIAKLEHAISE